MYGRGLGTVSPWPPGHCWFSPLPTWQHPHRGPQALPKGAGSCPPGTRMCFSALTSLHMIAITLSSLPSLMWPRYIFSLPTNLIMVLSLSHCFYAHNAACLTTWSSLDLPQIPLSSRGVISSLFRVRKLSLKCLLPPGCHNARFLSGGPVLLFSTTELPHHSVIRFTFSYKARRMLLWWQKQVSGCPHGKKGSRCLKGALGRRKW